MKISKIFLYDEPAVQEIQISNLKNFLLENFSADVEIKKCIFNHMNEKTIKKISGSRIFDPKTTFKLPSNVILPPFFPPLGPSSIM